MRLRFGAMAVVGILWLMLCAVVAAAQQRCAADKNQPIGKPYSTLDVTIRYAVNSENAGNERENSRLPFSCGRMVFTVICCSCCMYIVKDLCEMHVRMQHPTYLLCYTSYQVWF